MATETEEAPPSAPATARVAKPLGTGGQVLVLVASFLGGPAVGWVVGQVPGDLSETARTIVCVPFVLVFFLGYAAWLARVKTIAFRGLGVPILKALFVLLVHRRKPQVADVLPTRERLAEMVAKVQAAGAAFRRVAWLLGIAFGLAAALFDSAWGAAARFVLVSAGCIAWGYALTHFARRGWLPIPEEH
jgi:hypothetical protein